MENQKKRYDTLYIALPELSDNTIARLTNEGKILPKGTNRFDLHRKYIALALKNPGWVDTLSKEKHQDHLSRQKVFCTEEKLTEDICGERSIIFEPVETALIIRSFELMLEEYPNLCFTRGHEFSPDSGVTGFDFSLGDIKDAINFATRLDNAVVALLSIKQFVEYAKNAIIDGSNPQPTWSESSWLRNSYVINFKNDNALQKSMLSIYRLKKNG